MSGSPGFSVGGTDTGESARKRNTSANERPDTVGAGRGTGCDAAGGWGGVAGSAGPDDAGAVTRGAATRYVPRLDASMPADGVSTGTGRGRGLEGRGFACTRSAVQRGGGIEAGTGAGSGIGRSAVVWAGDAGAGTGWAGLPDGTDWGGACGDVTAGPGGIGASPACAGGAAGGGG